VHRTYGRRALLSQLGQGFRLRAAVRAVGADRGPAEFRHCFFISHAVSGSDDRALRGAEWHDNADDYDACSMLDSFRIVATGG